MDKSVDKVVTNINKTAPTKYLAWAWLCACAVWSTLLFAIPSFALYIVIAVCLVILLAAGLVTAQNYGFTARFVKSSLDLFFLNHSNDIYQFMANVWHFELKTTLAQSVRIVIGGLAIVSVSVLVFIWRYLESVPSTPNAGVSSPQVVAQPVATVLIPPATLTPIPTFSPIGLNSPPSNAVMTSTALTAVYAPATRTASYSNTNSQAPIPTETVPPAGAVPAATQPSYDSILQSVVPRIVIVEVTTSTVPSRGGYIGLANFGNDVNLTGWRLEDNGGNVFEFPDYVLGANALVRIHFVAGRDTNTDLFWRSSYRTNMSAQSTVQWVLIDNVGATVDIY